MIPKSLPQIAAHRGLAWTYPPNSMVAYEAAAECAVAYIELDFHASSDGQLVCFHDRVVDRYVSQHQPDWMGRAVGSLSLTELLTIDVNTQCDASFAGTPMPTLLAVLKRFACATSRVNKGANPKLMIEHKSGTAAQLMATIQQANADLDQLVVMSFDWDFLAALRQLSAVLPLVLLGKGPLEASHLKTAADLQAVAMHWGNTLTVDEVEQIHAASCEAWVYTLNEPAQWRHGINIGLDVITTDRCDELATMLKGYVRQ